MNNFSINSVTAAQSQPNTGSVKGTQGTGFGEVLKESIEAVSEQINESKKLTDGLVSGQHSNIHEAMIAMEKSGIAVKLMTRVQSKVIDAYKEVMRLQL